MKSCYRGQLSNLITEKQDCFHDEKNALLKAGIKHASYLHTDDTGARHAGKTGHIPIFDKNPRRNKALKLELEAERKRCRKLNVKTAESIRYNERSTVERVNGRFKDEFGGRMLKVRGAEKVMCHLTFGILALTADQLLKIVT